MVFITGASGFIGVALARRLAGKREEPVVALVRRLGTAGTARLATITGVRMIHGDVRDQSVLNDAMRGCRAVIHCAVEGASSQKIQHETTTLGTRAVLEASQKNGVRKLVFLSTAAVHSWRAPGCWDEEAALVNGDLYSRSKIEAERLLMNNGRLPVTIIRPTCVYGPFAPTWTVAPVQYLRLEIPLVASDNSGMANLIYIDNLVDLILSALDSPDEASRVYIANDDEPLEWGSLFSAYAEAIGLPLHRYSSPHNGLASLREEISVSINNLSVLLGAVSLNAKSSLISNFRAFHRHVPLIQRFARVIPRSTFMKLSAISREDAGNGGSSNDNVRRLQTFAPRGIRKFYSGQARFSAQRAKNELKWEPRIRANEAIAKTCAWIRYSGI